MTDDSKVIGLKAGEARLAVPELKKENSEVQENNSIFDDVANFFGGLFSQEQEAEKYYPLDKMRHETTNSIWLKEIDELQQVQDEIGTFTRNGKELTLTIDFEKTDDKKYGVRLGDLKELYGIKDGAIMDRNYEDLRYRPRSDMMDYNNLDNILVNEGTQIYLNMNDLETDYYNIDYEKAKACGLQDMSKL